MSAIFAITAASARVQLDPAAIVTDPTVVGSVGTGSCPPAQSGWQRHTRLKANQLPRPTPWRLTASRA